ncbi:hypothetical protein [Paenibacillus mucilaginosus]|uniref:hypothetical protein n=1 Tax=Paenibacillus mucilaginosus TaxID=61624 RepID=UPI003D1A2614
MNQMDRWNTKRLLSASEARIPLCGLSSAFCVEASTTSYPVFVQWYDQRSSSIQEAYKAAAGFSCGAGLSIRSVMNSKSSAVGAACGRLAE